MTIKTKLTLNVVIVLVIIGAVAATSIIGMGFVKSKLSYLTEHSTPFQMRTIEFQKSIQSTIADLVRVSAANNITEYKSYRSEAEKSLAECKKAQSSLEALSGEAKMETMEELNRIAAELFEITEGRLAAEEEGLAANKSITQKLNAASFKLKELDGKIKGLQLNRSANLVTSLEDTKGISSKLRSIEMLKTSMKDLQLALYELQMAQDKKGLIIGRGKANSALNKMLQNDFVSDSSKIQSDIKGLGEKIEEMVKLQQSNGENKNQADNIRNDINERLSVIMLSIEQELVAASDKNTKEITKQGDVFTQSNIANNILVANSGLLSLGLSIEGLTTKLFTGISFRELDSVESEIKKDFEKIEPVRKLLEKSLKKLDAKEEIKTLLSAGDALTSTKGLLLGGNGVVSKIRNQLKMREKAMQATDKLRGIVLKQAEKGKETVTVARGEQEKAIGMVNKMVRFSTMLVIGIGLGATVFGIVFGTWIYRSIAKPLNELIWATDRIAEGDLTCAKNEYSKDEIGMVHKSMCKMTGNLGGIVGKIKASTGSLARSSENLSSTAVRLEKGSGEQTLRIEQSATAMTEMSQTTLDVAKNASHTADVAQNMKKVALQGKDAMRVTMQELQRFAETVRESAVKVESLGKKSEEINGIITLIKDIAEQTNLLALNAAIEAARAGEQGRGFAIVADNVRQLAERTTVATGDIGSTVSAMQTEVSDSVNFMKEERESIGKVLNHVDSTLKSIDEIVLYVEQVADMVQRIAVATEEQSSASEEISQNMENIAVTTRDLSNSVVEIKRASENLSRLAVELNSTAGWFNV